MAWVSDSDSQIECSLEATQVSQPVYHGTQSSQFYDSQVEPRQKYWAILVPSNPKHTMLKIPWSRSYVQIGRGDPENTVTLKEKRVSNKHCVISPMLPREPRDTADRERMLDQLRNSEAAPEVFIEDKNSSNGTYVNGHRLGKGKRRVLVHGDEVSLGHASTIETQVTDDGKVIEGHDVRYIFRSVGRKGAHLQDGDIAGEVYENYQMLESLGAGTFAEVKKAVHLETGDLRAIKQIIKRRFGHNPKTLELFQREIDICAELHHENICRMIEYYTDPQHIYLVLEYIDGGDLLEYIMDYPREDGLPEADAADLAFQICRAMAYCHEKGVTHRDLKPENILLTKETESQGRIIKIADFGLAKMVHAETVLVSMVGTPQYLAPEVVMQSRYRPGYENVVDSWAVGIIVYSMLTKALPFDDDESLSVTERIVQRYSKDFDRVALHARGVSELAIDFISRLIEPDASKRMSMQDALEHEWLAGPASLPSENPPSQSLGGDSMWNIEAFDSSHYMDTDGKPVSRWSSSGTSLDPSNDSFSQPMEGLRLDSRARVDFPLSPAQEADEDRNRMDMTTSPPPHVTPDTSMDEDAAPEPDSPPIEPIAIDTSTTLPAASVVLGNKRKQLSFASAECLDAPSVRTIRPATNGNGVGDVAEIGNGAENGDASSNGDGGRRILTRSKTANATTHANAAANEATPKKTPKTKQDDAPRVGPRKSRRIG